MASPTPPPGDLPGQDPSQPWTPPPAPGGRPPYGTPGPGAPPPVGQPLAGRWRRLLAGIVDAVVVAILSTPFTYDTWAEVYDERTGVWHTEQVTHWFWGFLIGFLYYWLFHAYWNGQTPGKKILHMRVTREDGTRIGTGQAAVRSIVYVVLTATCCLGFLDLVWILFDRRKQALHDKAASTLVVDA
ncbi:RDD family protein [Herbidospora cretacea]|uniref:RDD family protein n=1 Tax=Herbidospora cretacea TaxID=28444 RepID=UPI0009ED1490|nr:RDD family protein [Herbidospora cretacea]